MEKFDVVIVGAGIIGLSVARALKARQPSLKILVCEKEDKVGLHASSRNSGVLHAGFYYSPESLKAKFCRDGNRQLRDFADARGLKSREGVKLAGGAVASGEGLRGVHCRVSRGIPQG